MSLLLRRWSENDLPALILLANNPKIADNLTNGFPHPYTEEAAKRFIGMATAEPLTRIFCMEYDGHVAGGIGLHPQQDIMCKNMELGYWVGEPYWGKGIATQAVKETVAYGFSHFDITRIYARPFGSNLASARVLENAGFALEARLKQTIYKNGRFEDELIYAVRRT